MDFTVIIQLFVVGLSCVNSLHATPKYSTPVEKIKSTVSKIPQPPPLPTGHIKNYVDFDLKSQSSRFGKDEIHHYSHGPYPYDHYYPTHDFSPYYGGKGHDIHHMLPYIIGGFGVLVLPLLTLMLTLAVNIAPASTIPTAITTATGKFMDSFNSTNIISDIRDRLESALNKYGSV